MGMPPAYLCWHLAKIRRHAGEPGYIERRINSRDLSRAIVEKSLLDELNEEGLIVTAAEYERSACFGENVVMFPEVFHMAPRGHYLLIEAVFSLAGLIAWTFVAALLGGLAAVAISG